MALTSPAEGPASAWDPSQRDVCRAIFISSITAVPWSHMPFYTGPELVEIKAGKIHVAQLCAIQLYQDGSLSGVMAMGQQVVLDRGLQEADAFLAMWHSTTLLSLLPAGARCCCLGHLCVM